MKERTLLLVDDDEIFCAVLEKALIKRRFKVQVAYGVDQAIEQIILSVPGYAIVDLNMPNGSGLKLIPVLKENNPEMQIVVLTGYASIATAVEAVKMGATNYLTKPSDADEIVAALDAKNITPGDVGSTQTMSSGRMEWEHIQKVLNDSDGNISEAARRLGMHRRTLQRKLQKRPSGLK